MCSSGLAVFSFSSCPILPPPALATAANRPGNDSKYLFRRRDPFRYISWPEHANNPANIAKSKVVVVPRVVTVKDAVPSALPRKPAEVGYLTFGRSKSGVLIGSFCCQHSHIDSSIKKSSRLL